jgi:hypothetical protein
MNGEIQLEPLGLAALGDLGAEVGLWRLQLGVRWWNLYPDAFGLQRSLLDLAVSGAVLDTAAFDWAPRVRVEVTDRFGVGGVDAGVRIRWPGAPVAVRLGDRLLTWQLSGPAGPVVRARAAGTFELQVMPIVALRLDGWWDVPPAAERGEVQRFGGALAVLSTPLPNLDAGPRLVLDEYLGPAATPGVAWTIGATVTGRVRAWTAADPRD